MGDLEWVYTFRDSSTTSGAYDVVTTLDPSAYTTINEKDLIDIQNLAGNLNAVVLGESGFRYTGAYLIFLPIMQRILRWKIFRNM